jgi:hypothetical protein
MSTFSHQMAAVTSAWAILIAGRRQSFSRYSFENMSERAGDCSLSNTSSPARRQDALAEAFLRA